MGAKKEKAKQLALVIAMEGQFRGMVREGGVNPKDILIALHNVCCHGDLIEDFGGDLDENDVMLGKLFDGFDISIAAFKEMGL